MSDQTLPTLFDQVRQKTLKLLVGVSDRQVRWAPAGLDNSILWHAGHAYVVVECLISEAIAEEPDLPDGWYEMFGWESHPADIPDDRWPSLEAIVVRLNEQHRRLSTRLAAISEAQLDAISPGYANRTVRAAIVHAIHDEACHSGEIWLLRKIVTAHALEE